MTTFYDYYFDTSDANAFLELLATEENIIGPLLGRADLGSDPQRVYIAVRARVPLAVPEGAVASDTGLATQLLGVWA